jgi:rubredoxin
MTVEQTEAPVEAPRWLCEMCGFIYDPEEGDPDSGIPPGTAFEDIPDDWMCPICGAEKSDFRALEPGEFPEM